ncbi:MAG: type II secretion system protein GspE [Desulfuromonas sp.]|nr:MAG: type II secretion system protein GspE [Desulfuromonas sp.]
MPAKKLGELLIESKLINEDQFAKALEAQRMTPNIPIGQVLCQLGYITTDDLNLVLDFNRKRLKLGEILVQQKLIDQDKLDKALSLSQKEKIPVGKALLRLHFVEAEQLARAISTQYDLPYISLEKQDIAPELAHFVNANFAVRHRIIPIERNGRIVTMAMAFPLSSHALHELETISHCQIRPVIAREGDIQIAQENLYGIRHRTSNLPADALELNLVEDLPGGDIGSKYVLDHNVEHQLKQLLTTGVKAGASDIHLEQAERGMQVRFRIDGVLQRLDFGDDTRFVNKYGRQLVSKIKILCDLDITERRRPQDGSFTVKVAREGKSHNIDFRVSTIPTRHGENIVIRILDKRGPMSLESVGFSHNHIDQLQQLLTKPTGIFLVTGPTGSGKTSTLYAILDKINRPGVKTLTVENPIEYSIDGISQSEVNETIGNTFAVFLRAFLRQDPDNIMVGEIRDQETASIAIRASLTGHTVLSTLHTNDSTSAVTRLIDMGVESNLVSSSMRCIIAQRLVRRICPLCKEPYQPEKEHLKELLLPTEAPLRLLHGKGCNHCHFTGFSGRIPIIEMWMPSREEVLLINRGADNATLRDTAFVNGNTPTMLEDGLNRVRSSETTIEELLRVVPYEQIEEFRRKSKLHPFPWQKKGQGKPSPPPKNAPETKKAPG